MMLKNYATQDANMAQVRYAISGSPVTHSLSPLLHNLVLANLEKFGDDIELKSKKSSVHLVDTRAIEDALGWGYAGHAPHTPDWEYTAAPFGKFRTDALLKKAIDAAMEIEDAEQCLASVSDSNPVVPLTSENRYLEAAVRCQLPTQCLENEVWMNLTSPLKHQLVSEAISTIDDSMRLQSVNTLRWDGQAWWCASVDGSGVVALAQHHGVDIKSGAVLGIIGGGGAARSTADAWLKAGGKISALPGRRTLELPYEFESQPPTKSIDFSVDFEGSDSDGSLFPNSNLRLNPAYSIQTGELETRFSSLITQPLDGRWMLVAQHLEAWKRLWTPQYANFLPSLELLLTQLVHAENLLEKYA
ncbi:MAG: hypothetical protein DWC09_04955 [Candidatus Poseidoniales archaeon]|nr:MAG: hypothetical protein DWC09_04955 [Candidatus Poseidoniales archaeon]